MIGVTLLGSWASSSIFSAMRRPCAQAVVPRRDRAPVLPCGPSGAPLECGVAVSETWGAGTARAEWGIMSARLTSPTMTFDAAVD